MKLPPLHTAELRAENLLSAGGMIVPKYCLTMSELLLGLVVHDLGLVLGADAPEVVLLGLRNAQLVPRRLDVIGHVIPGLHLVHRLYVVEDVVEVDLREIGPPRGHRLAPEDVEALVADLAHPVRLALAVRHHVDDLVRQTLLGRLGVGGLVVPAVLVVALESPYLLVFLLDLLLLLDLEVLGFGSHQGYNPFR
jgi:hypothetical protein